MKPFPRLLVALLPLVLGSGITAVCITSHSNRVPLITVADVRGLLVRSPAAWLGRTVAVRGIAVTSGCQTWPYPENTSCRDWVRGLADSRRTEVLPLAYGAPNPLLAYLRGVPMLGSLVPPPQLLRWGVMATYRVQLRTASAGSCAYLRCYEAVLLDTAP
jgi:hypothetical protein